MHLSSIIKPTMEPVHGQQFGRPSVEKCDYSKLLPTNKESFRKVRKCSDRQAKSTIPAELSVRRLHDASHIIIQFPEHELLSSFLLGMIWFILISSSKSSSAPLHLTCTCTSASALYLLLCTISAPAAWPPMQIYYANLKSAPAPLQHDLYKNTTTAPPAGASLHLLFLYYAPPMHLCISVSSLQNAPPLHICTSVAYLHIVTLYIIICCISAPLPLCTSSPLHLLCNSAPALLPMHLCICTSLHPCTCTPLHHCTFTSETAPSLQFAPLTSVLLQYLLLPLCMPAHLHISTSSSAPPLHLHSFCTFAPPHTQLHTCTYTSCSAPLHLINCTTCTCCLLHPPA